MRRFWAHIILVVTALVMMGTSFAFIFTRVNTNLEYKEGTEITYRILEKDDHDAEIEDNTGVKNIASKMEGRLSTMGVNAYKVYTSGNDIIKVQFAESNDTQKNNVVTYLAFDGSLALSNMDDDENYLHIIGDEFLLNNNNNRAYLDNVNGYPTLVIPINKDSAAFNDLVERTKEQAAAGKGEKSQDADGNEVTTTYLYLWYNFDENNDRYSRTISSSSDYDVNIANKIIMRFNIDNLYYPDGKDDKLATSLNVDMDGNNTVTLAEVTKAWNNARFYINLLNAEAYDYDVRYINYDKTTFVPATSEVLITSADPHQYLAWSRTLFATIFAIVVVALLLVVFFRLVTLSIATVSIASVFAAVGFMVVLSAEFNIAALVGIIAVAICSLASGILYASRLKEEIYKGRNIKKANSEAARRSLIPMVDIHLALLVVGALTFAFGGSLMRSFALIAVVGGLSSFLLNAIILRCLNWLLANNTAFYNKVNYFGAEPEKVPVSTEETKVEAHLGMFEGKDFTKRSRRFFICACTLFVASLAGLITFSVLNNGNPYAQASGEKYSQVYVYSTNEYATLDSLEDKLLKQIIVYENADDTTGKTLDTYIKESKVYTYAEMIDKVQVDTHYFEYTLNKNLDENTTALAGFLPGASKDTLKNVLNEYNGYDAKTKASVKVTSLYYVNKANFWGIALASGIASVIMGVYFMLRYRLSRGMTALLLPLGTSVIGIGLFALTRIAFPSVTGVMIPLVVVFNLIIAVYIMAKDKEVFIEDKVREVTLEHRFNLMKKALSISMNEILILAIVAIYIAINFFAIGPTSNSLMFVLVSVAFILGGMFLVTTFSRTSLFFYKRFAPIENRKPKVKKKKNVVSATHKSNEPEEAVFIGIND